MWRLGECPYCDGDLFVADDDDGWYGQCLQCGRRYGLMPLVIPKHPVAEEAELVLIFDGFNEDRERVNAS